MSTRRELTTSLLSLSFAATAQTEKPETIPEDSELSARIISYTLFGEARGETLKGKMAIAAVIHTRANLKNKSYAEICLQEAQFSCWNKLDGVPANYSTGIDMLPIDVKARNECYCVAWLLISGQYKWESLTHFYNPDKVTPAWAVSLRRTQKIGKHIFGYSHIIP
ncbi:Spore cortex-lytic enzyme [Pontiella desulfatans]|uniref:Spore cortex-lytic enzyme n=1 Tax=Pontiella desulfatans TaxID=2750659 RepID=A0A6C2U698_PONDE|nr:cell wall hydrolase [Pontiella desulfatans]VGO15369.1 Spore cortex-lytic enzyme [Pontiella desulfatans]